MGGWIEFFASLQDLIEKGEKQPNLTIGILVSVVVVFLTIFFRIVFGGKKKPVSRNPCFSCAKIKVHSRFYHVIFLSLGLCLGVYIFITEQCIFLCRQEWRRQTQNPQKLPLTKAVERMKKTKRRKHPPLHVGGQGEIIEMIETWQGRPIKITTTYKFWV